MSKGRHWLSGRPDRLPRIPGHRSPPLVPADRHRRRLGSGACNEGPARPTQASPVRGGSLQVVHARHRPGRAAPERPAAFVGPDTAESPPSAPRTRLLGLGPARSERRGRSGAPASPGSPGGAPQEVPGCVTRLRRSPVDLLALSSPLRCFVRPVPSPPGGARARCPPRRRHRPLPLPRCRVRRGASYRHKDIGDGRPCRRGQGIPWRLS